MTVDILMTKEEKSELSPNPFGKPVRVSRRTSKSRPGSVNDDHTSSSLRVSRSNVSLAPRTTGTELNNTAVEMVNSSFIFTNNSGVITLYTPCVCLFADQIS